ncbi:efflux RND transporter periplasmic adaptor subunit [Seleniivibrio woodruffii]|uniref:RND family efflux transporter MFP subunit n=1 Tax=Seleniivibrio woodruffii TaxID=1078050 RepID=A0A4R1KCG9_9BACT|nr:efflux RND transporter periplasmic adaptor subunit [Seleniivibrio woodruffii]TCK62184.1 RND family efflux transporter MFP subunit [Seleniivibrio woodruffii]TVZ34699.1 RND family efflux transporter MFP subunit [Seleniivibrio woodruffii]
MLRKFIVSAAILSLLTACGGEKKEEAAKTPATVKVQLHEVKLTDADSTRVFTATVSSDKTAVMIPKVTGYVEQILVTPGQQVKAGQLLAVIKSGELEQKMAIAASGEMETQNAMRQAEIGYKMAKSEFDLAEKTYNRYLNLIRNSSVSKQEFDQVESQYKLAKENLALSAEKVQQAKIRSGQAGAMRGEVNTYLSYTQLRAPFDGVVLEKNMDAGNLANPGSPVLKVGNNVPVIVAYISQNMISALKLGTKATVSIDSTGEEFESKVLEISPDIDPATGNFKVKLSGSEKLAQGMFAKVRFITGVEKVIAVPDSAVVIRGQLSLVFVNDKGKADMRVVKTGRDFGGFTEILSGLSAGEKVVSSNAAVLKSGDILEAK